MSARRRSMSGEVEQGGAPRVLLRAGLSDPLWESPVQVAAWCERHGLPAPLDAYAPHPRALRDHAAYWWAVKERPHPRFAARPDVGVWQKLGIPGPGRARMQARMKFLGVPGAWQYTDILDA